MIYNSKQEKEQEADIDKMRVVDEEAKIIGKQLRQLREGAGLSQMKISERSGYRQPNIARYESGQASPPLKILLWYADYFNVSLDYIFARTAAPQGKYYEYNPRIEASSEEIGKFIEMCFDPSSPVGEKMKSTLVEMFKEEEKQR